jgi:hypothetical protein
MKPNRAGALALAAWMALNGAAVQPAYAAQATATAAPQTTEAVATAPLTTAPPATETPIDPGARPDYVEQLLTVARGELGYTEGPNNYSKYGEWSGDPNAAWCAEFICWCVDQTDQLYGSQLLNVVYPKYSGQNTGRDWFIARGRFVYRRGNCPNWGYQWLKGSDHLMCKNEYVPRSGDLVFFSYNEAGDTEHVALVEYCAKDAKGNVTIHVIEGNNPSTVQRNSYALNNSQVLGFGTCEDVADTTLRYGCSGDKVLTLQQQLTALGYLDAKDQTGTYGSNTKAAVANYQQTMEGQPITGIADRATQQAVSAQLQKMEFVSPDTWLVEE